MQVLTSQTGTAKAAKEADMQANPAGQEGDVTEGVRDVSEENVDGQGNFATAVIQRSSFETDAGLSSSGKLTTCDTPIKTVPLLISALICQSKYR